MKKYIDIIYSIMALLLFLGLQEQVRVVIDKCLLPVFAIQSHWALDMFFGGLFVIGGYELIKLMANKDVMIP